MSKKIYGISELLFATLIWGFGFVATHWALEFFDSATINFSRFFLAFIFGFAISLIFFKKTFGPTTVRKISAQLIKDNLVLSAGPGILLGIMIGLQTWGLELTSVTNSGFITTLYVVFVPIISFIFYKATPRIWHFLWLATSLLGTAFMVNLQFTNLNMGDIYTLVCAVLGAGQMVWLERISNKIQSAFIFNTFQSFWAFIATLIFWPIYGRIHISMPDTRGIIAMCSLIFGSTLLAFALQVKAQKVLTANLASIIFLLESPFAAMFGFFLLNEEIGTLKAIGAFLILTAALGASRTAKDKT